MQIEGSKRNRQTEIRDQYGRFFHSLSAIYTNAWWSIDIAAHARAYVTPTVSSIIFVAL